MQRQEYYLARLAAMIYSAVTKKPAPLKDFVFDFTPVAAPTEEDLQEEEKRQKHIQESKSAWAAIVHSKPQLPSIHFNYPYLTAEDYELIYSLAEELDIQLQEDIRRIHDQT